MKTLQSKIAVFLGLAFLALSANAQLDRSKMPKPGPEPTINLEKPNEFKLDNGITVLVVENNKLPRVSYQLSIDNKPYKEGDKAGVASLLSSMLGNGTTSISKDKFNEEVDFLGANISFGSSGGFGSGLVKYADRIVELMADATINPLLTEEEFKKEKDKLIEGLKTGEKSTDEAASRVGSALSYGKDHVYGEYITQETVNNVTFQDVLDLYKIRFAPNNAYIVVVGDIKPRKVKKQLKKYFGNWEKVDLKEIPEPKLTADVAKTEINFVDMGNATQSNITVSNNVDLKQSDEDYFAALMANNILGGGGEGYLFKNLREDKGYTYGAYSRLGSSRYGVSRFSASAKVRNSVTDSAVVEFLKEIKRIRTEPVEEQTLANAKAKYVGNFVMALERPQTIASYALNIKRNNLPEDFYAKYLENINKVSVEDVQRAANKYFKLDNARIVIVGKASEALENLEKVGIPIKYYDKYANATKKPELNIPLPENLDATKVIDKYIEAIGGKEKISSIETMMMVYEAEIQGNKVQLTRKTSGKNKEASTIAAGGMVFQKQVFDGEKGYFMQQGRKQDLDGKRLETAKSKQLPIEDVAYKAGKLDRIEKVDGNNAYVIVFNDQEIYYDVKSGLKVKSVTIAQGPQGEVKVPTTFSDYKAVQGILIPHRLGVANGPMVFDFIMKEAKINEGVEDKDFE